MPQMLFVTIRDRIVAKDSASVFATLAARMRMRSEEAKAIPDEVVVGLSKYSAAFLPESELTGYC